MLHPEKTDNNQKRSRKYHYNDIKGAPAGDTMRRRKTAQILAINLLFNCNRQYISYEARPFFDKRGEIFLHLKRRK